MTTPSAVSGRPVWSPRRSLRWLARAAAVVVAAAVAPRADAQTDTAGAFRLARIFGDGMVLQRGARIPVWGWAAPGAAVAVTLHGRTARARADGAGSWRVTFPALGAGGPYELAAEAGPARVAVHDVLVGDVWVASGQSNMELAVAAADSAAEEIGAAHDSSIRQFKVPLTWAEAPAADLAGGGWVPADPAHAGAFTAVGYYFARDLRRTERVPIGIVNTTWGGSNVETWMSRRALGLSDRAWAETARRWHAQDDAIREALRARIGGLPAADSGLVDGRARWADPTLDDSGWATIPVPTLWERVGYDGLDGIAWYRGSFTLSEEEAKQGVRLALGKIDDNDISWVNGTEVGRTDGYDRPRVYEVPPAALRAGRNVVAVRVQDTGGGGGMYGDPSLLYLEVGGARRPLPSAWKFKVGAVSFAADAQRINKVPTILYNRMLHPLLPLAIRGVIWYQGESNANSDAQAAAYRGLFAGLIRGWRREWKGTHGAFPFLWVQLPGFGAVDSVPQDRPAWAVLRESQTAALALPRTGQAVAIDLGEQANIHPRNKQEVGRRLALVARTVAYGKRLVASGPTYRRVQVRGGRLVLAFDHMGGGLITRGADGTVRGFTVAGADHRFVRAEARIEGGRVEVWSDRVLHPVAARYAWADFPLAATLYNRAGLPARPFRTDRW
jgi:sialate O-acetylesterase